MPIHQDNAVYCSPLIPVAYIDADGYAADLNGPKRITDIPDAGLLPDELLALSEDVLAIERFVASLSPRERGIVHRVFWGGETQADVARDLGVSKMAISKVIGRIARLGRIRLAQFRHSPLLTN